MEYTIKKELLQAIANVMAERPYKEVFLIVDEIRKIMDQQDKLAAIKVVDKKP